MKKVMAVALVLMIFAFGIVAIHAQQTDVKDHGMMMRSDCPMMSTAGGAKCATGNDGKCPMDAGKCPMPSHHGSRTSSVQDHGH